MGDILKSCSLSKSSPFESNAVNWELEIVGISFHARVVIESVWSPDGSANLVVPGEQICRAKGVSASCWHVTSIYRQQELTNACRARVEIHCVTYKVGRDFKTARIMPLLTLGIIYCSKLLRITLPDFQVILNTTNSCRDMHLVTRRCITNETICGSNKQTCLISSKKYSVPIIH